MSVSNRRDGGPRLLFLNQTPRCYSKRRTVAERKIINIHVQQNQHRKQRLAAIQRLQDGTWNFFALAFPPKTVKTPPGFHQVATGLSREWVDLSSIDKSTATIKAVQVDHNSSPEGLPANGRDATPLDEDSALNSYFGGVQKQSWSETFPCLPSEVVQHSQSIPSFLDTASLDPFGNSAMPITKTMNFILSHYVKIIIPLVYPVQLQATSANQQILQIALANPIVLNSMLAVSSVQQQTPSKTGLPMSVHARNPDYLRHKISAIRMINDAMSDPSEAGKASTIFAINNVMTIETMIGNDAEVQIHIRGIERILSMRGGLHGLPMLIVELLLPCLYMSSAWTGSRPLFSPPKLPGYISLTTNTLIALCLPPALHSLCTGLLSPGVQSFFSPTMLTTIHALKSFTLFREHFRTATAGLLLQELQHITILGLHIEYHLLALPFKENQHPIQEAVRNALLMYKNGLYGIHSPTATIYRALVSRMKLALDISDLANFWSPAKELLIWVLCMGAHHSAGEKERPWFIMQITRGSRILQLKSFGDLQNLLRRFCYLDRIYEKQMTRIWEEVELLMTAWHGMI
jgi:hypothetical protein